MREVQGAGVILEAVKYVPDVAPVEGARAVELANERGASERVSGRMSVIQVIQVIKGRTQLGSEQAVQSSPLPMPFWPGPVPCAHFGSITHWVLSFDRLWPSSHCLQR